jgi:hypothetical protein
MSVEFLIISPEWRKSLVGISLSEVIISLSTKIFKATNADALIGTARRDVKVNDSCYKLGFFSVESSVQRRNFEVDLIAALKKDIKMHPDFETSALVKELWANKTDFTKLISDENKQFKKIA